MNIAPIGFVDTWACSSALFTRYKERFSGDHHSMDMLPLHSEEGSLPLLAEWKSAKGLLARVRTALAPFFGGQTPRLGVAALVRLKAGGHVEWQVDEGAWPSFHLPLVPSPGAWLYSGGEGAVLPVGQLTYVNRAVLNSAVNLGNHPVIHLVLDARADD